VGSGNSGVQIATELSARREVWLARERDFSLPRRLSGLEFQALLEKIGVTDRRVELSNESDEADLMWWMQRMGLYDMPTDSAFGRLLASGVDPYIGQSISVVAAEHGFRLLPRVVDAKAEAYLLEDGSSVRPDIVIWATGYRFDYGWASDLTVTDVDGIPLQQDGVSPVAGFYFLGLQWMRRADSGLLKGVGRDAAFLTKTISHRLNHTTAVRA
jgi:putative flavoprotein involved in K+ transport